MSRYNKLSLWYGRYVFVIVSLTGKKSIHLYFQCIVHGLIGVNGQGVLSLVEEDHNKGQEK